MIGGGSQLKGLREYLEEVFQVPVYPVGLLSIEGIQITKDLTGKDSTIYQLCGNNLVIN